MTITDRRFIKYMRHDLGVGQRLRQSTSLIRVFCQSLAGLWARMLGFTLSLKSNLDSMSPTGSRVITVLLLVVTSGYPARLEYFSKVRVTLPHFSHRDVWAWPASQVAIFHPPLGRPWLYSFIPADVFFGHTLQTLVCLLVELQFGSSSADANPGQEI